MRPARGLPGGVVLLLALAAATVAVIGLHLGARLAGPVLLALTLAVTVSPLTGWLRRHGCPAWLAITCAVATVYAALAVVVGAVAISVDRLVELLPTYGDNIAALRSDVAGALTRLGLSADAAHDSTRWIDPAALARAIGGLAGGVWAGLLQALLLLTLVLFMCADATGLQERLAGAGRRRPLFFLALRDFARGTRRYVAVTTAFGLAVAVVDTVGLWLFGVPLPVLWGLLSFTTNYIPNIGFFIGLVPPALLALLDGGPGKMLAVVVTYCAVNFVIQSVIQPKVVGDAVGLSTTVSFLSVVFWAAVLGPLGALLAVPLSLLVKALFIDAHPATRWIAPLVGARSVERGSPRKDEDRIPASPPSLAP